MIGQFQGLDSTLCTVVTRIERSPHGTKAEAMSCKEDILSSRRAVLYPKLAPFAFKCFLHIATNDDGQWSLFQHFGVGIGGSQFL